MSERRWPEAAGSGAAPSPTPDPSVDHQDEDPEADGTPPLPPMLRPYAGLLKTLVLTVGALTLSIVYHWCAGPEQSSERLPSWLLQFLRRLLKALT